MPSTIGSVLVLVGFVIPGFITLWVWSLAYGRTEPSEGRLVLEGITLSCVNYGAWSWLLVWAWARSWIHSAVPAILLAAFILFVSPMILGVTTVWLSETIWVAEGEAPLWCFQSGAKGVGPLFSKERIVLGSGDPEER